MHFSVQWFNDNFNLKFHKKAGDPEFFSVKGCRIVQGSKGPFVSYPSQKKSDGSGYWNHCFADQAFNEYVLKLAQEGQPQQRNAQGATRSNDLETDTPFNKRKDY